MTITNELGISASDLKYFVITVLALVLATWLTSLKFKFVKRFIRLVRQHWAWIAVALCVIILMATIYSVFGKWEAMLLSIGHFVLFILLWIALQTIGLKKPGTLLFYEHAESDAKWSKFEEGRVIRSEEFAHRGKFSLKKEFHNDPHGGYKKMKKSAGLGLLFSGYIYRPSNFKGGGGDRLAIENSDFNGYGFCVDHRGNGDRIWVERRYDGSYEVLSITQPSFQLPLDDWYYFEFYLKKGGQFDLHLKTSSDESIPIISATDKKYKSFDRVVVHGGHHYYIDELRVEVL